MPDLLLELFSEEIPARMQARAAADLKKLVTDGLVTAGLTYGAAGAFATPRRLVLSVEGLTVASAVVREERKGPRADAPAAAIDGFLRSTGLTRAQVVVREVGKADVLFAVVEKPGRQAPAIIAEVVEAAIRGFPWPKSMRWGEGSLRWVRPLHSILCILSDEAGVAVVPFAVDGIVAGNTTEGHRFLAPGRFAVSSFDDYATKLKRAFVVLDAQARADHIWADASNMAFACGLEVVADAGLLAEVAGLVEWPVALMGMIDPAFLDLPPEVLQTSMREHQKFFSVRNPVTGRIERFITVANTEPRDHGALILKGNQKVLAARLSDAKFFYENDLRTVAQGGMEAMAAGLASVTFHNKLGSQADRVARIAALAREIAPLVGADPDLAALAATVAKADLQSAMVGEFPELQGVMGVYYARAAGLPEAVAMACKAHWQPLGPSDEVPTEPVSVAVALADKIDTLAGFWAIDEKPTGSKDPYALRRAALGVIRILLQDLHSIHLSHHLELGLIQGWLAKIASDPEGEGLGGVLVRKLMEIAERKHSVILEPTIKGFPDVQDLDSLASNHIFADSIAHALALSAADLLAFFHDRLKVYLKDQGIRHDVIDACLAMPGNDDLSLLVRRAEALAAMLKSEEGANLLAGFKRANNILSAEEKKDGVEYSLDPEVKFAEGPEERALFAALDQAQSAIAPAMAAEDFGAAMAAMAALRAPVDAFFTAVQVNAASQILRRNRLCLLHRIRAICGQVADLGRIEG